MADKLELAVLNNPVTGSQEPVRGEKIGALVMPGPLKAIRVPTGMTFLGEGVNEYKPPDFFSPSQFTPISDVGIDKPLRRSVFQPFRPASFDLQSWNAGESRRGFSTEETLKLPVNEPPPILRSAQHEPRISFPLPTQESQRVQLVSNEPPLPMERVFISPSDLEPPFQFDVIARALATTNFGSLTNPTVLQTELTIPGDWYKPGKLQVVTHGALGGEIGHRELTELLEDHFSGHPEWEIDPHALRAEFTGKNRNAVFVPLRGAITDETTRARVKEMQERNLGLRVFSFEEEERAYRPETHGASTQRNRGQGPRLVRALSYASAGGILAACAPSAGAPAEVQQIGQAETQYQVGEPTVELQAFPTLSGGAPFGAAPTVDIGPTQTAEVEKRIKALKQMTGSVPSQIVAPTIASEVPTPELHFLADAGIDVIQKSADGYPIVDSEDLDTARPSKLQPLPLKINPFQEVGWDWGFSAADDTAFGGVTNKEGQFEVRARWDENKGWVDVTTGEPVALVQTTEKVNLRSVPTTEGNEPVGTAQEGQVLAVVPGVGGVDIGFLQVVDQTGEPVFVSEPLVEPVDVAGELETYRIASGLQSPRFVNLSGGSYNFTDYITTENPNFPPVVLALGGDSGFSVEKAEDLRTKIEKLFSHLDFEEIGEIGTLGNLKDLFEENPLQFIVSSNRGDGKTPQGNTAEVRYHIRHDPNPEQGYMIVYKGIAFADITELSEAMQYELLIHEIAGVLVTGNKPIMDNRYAIETALSLYFRKTISELNNQSAWEDMDNFIESNYP